ncbi:MAG: class I SAM-dependent methyltransferase [Desulfobacterales bacterium]|nr:class I SAM-dependent methyltransferase [Desulfobacterales bacterium]MDJ0882994.1 class I SAM-dependent methyltransferase [Desulfobacterales bacterium]
MIRQPTMRFNAHLLQGEARIPIEAQYDSRFSLLIRFFNGFPSNQAAEFSKIVFQQNGDKIELGPCEYIVEPHHQNFQGRLVFKQAVYDLNSLFFKNKIDKLQTEFSNLPLILAHKSKIKSEFKEFTAHLTYDLNVYKNIFDTLDARYADEPEPIKQKVQEAIIETEGRKFMRFMDQKLEDFENIIIDYSKKEHERHGYYLRKQIWHFLMCAPFMARTNLKPRGYSGDSVMMKMLYDNRYEGRSTFAKLMHKHPNEHPAAQAVRNRRKLIATMLGELKTRGPKSRGQKIKVLSVACGPAFELQDILTSAQDCALFQFTLLDQDKSALSEAASQIAALENKFNTKIEVELLNESVRTMLTTPKLEKMWGQFDYIYSMGLFDYLTPPVAKAVIEKLYKILNRGGEMVVGNFHISNASRYYMEYWLDWVLYYRTEQDFIDLLKDLQTAESRVLFEETGSQMFLHVQKTES